MDRAVFGPVKKAVNTACDNWMRSNPGKVMSIYDIPGIVKTSFDIAVTPRNISSGFIHTGLWPVNTEIFQDADYLPSQVTDRPLTTSVSPGPSSSNLEISRSEEPALYPTSSTNDECPLANSILHDSHTPSPSILNLPTTPPQVSYETEDEPKSAEILDQNSPNLAIPENTLNTVTMPSTTESVVPSTVFTAEIIPVASTSRDTSITVTNIPFSPEILRPLPKAPPRKGNQTNRRKVKSAILTDTPVKDELAAIEKARIAKKKVKKPNFNETKTKKDLNLPLQPK